MKNGIETILVAILGMTFFTAVLVGLMVYGFYSCLGSPF